MVGHTPKRMGIKHRAGTCVTTRTGAGWGKKTVKQMLPRFGTCKKRVPVYELGLLAKHRKKHKGYGG